MRTLLTMFLIILFSVSLFANNKTVDCYLDAQKRAELSHVSSLKLCQGSTSVSTVDCYLDARKRAELSHVSSLRLCKRSTSVLPVDCYLDARKRAELSHVSSISLCSLNIKTIFNSSN